MYVCSKVHGTIPVCHRHSQLETMVLLTDLYIVRKENITNLRLALSWLGTRERLMNSMLTNESAC